MCGAAFWNLHLNVDIIFSSAISERLFSNPLIPIIAKLGSAVRSRFSVFVYLFPLILWCDTDTHNQFWLDLTHLLPNDFFSSVARETVILWILSIMIVFYSDFMNPALLDIINILLYFSVSVQFSLSPSFACLRMAYSPLATVSEGHHGSVIRTHSWSTSVVDTCC